MALSSGEAVGDLAVAAIAALSITDGSPAAVVPVVKRKVPSLPRGKEPPQIVVVVQEDKLEALTATQKLRTFTLSVVIVRAGGRMLAVDPVVQGWRQQIEQALDDKGKTAFAGISIAVTGARFNRCDCVGGPVPFDPTGLPKDVDWSGLRFSVEVIETRAT